LLLLDLSGRNPDIVNGGVFGKAPYVGFFEISEKGIPGGSKFLRDAGGGGGHEIKTERDTSKAETTNRVQSTQV
jgi:hypothetical protein